MCEQVEVRIKWVYLHWLEGEVACALWEYDDGSGVVTANGEVVLCFCRELMALLKDADVRKIVRAGQDASWRLVDTTWSEGLPLRAASSPPRRRGGPESG